MNNKEKIKHILIQVEKYRLKMDIRSQKLQNFLYYQHLKVSGASSSILWCGICGVQRKQANQHFKRAFKSLSELQKAQYYLLNVKNASLILNSKTTKIQNETIKTQMQSYRFKVLMKPNSIIKKQSIVNIEILRKQKVLKIQQQKIQIDLHNFLLRKSKGKDKTHIVLEATHQNYIGQTIRIDNCGLQFEDILNTLTLVWEQAQFQNVYEMIHRRTQKSTNSTRIMPTLQKPKSEMVQSTTQNEKNQKPLYSSQRETKAYKLLYNENDNDNGDAQWYQQIIESFSCFKNFDQIKFGQSHQNKGLRVRKLIMLINFENGLSRIEDLLRSQVGIAFMKPTIKTIKISNQNSNANILIQQLHYIQGKQIKFSYTRSFITYHGASYIVDKNYNTIKNEKQKNNAKRNSANVKHCVWRIREKGNNVEILAEGKVQYGKNSKDMAIMRRTTSCFIGELNKIMENWELTDRKFDLEVQEQKLSSFNQEQQLFYTIPGSLVDDPKPDLSLSCQFIDNIQMTSSKLQKNQKQTKQLKTKSIQSFSCRNSNSNNKGYLFQKHIEIPYIKSSPCLMNVPGDKHWLWQNQWVIKQNGDLVNVDQQKIEVQSSVLKLVLKNMGRNLFSGKSILNTSLPIQIFGVDSNLQRLARGYIFGPIFLQAASTTQDPVQRLKSAICFAIGFSLAYIKMQKPFNPILGQTYQALIDGCPVYGEQISHHPPISSLYMIGRGYKVYGSFQAKVQLGLNSAAGINQGFNNIQFERFKGRIRFTSPPGELSGLVYGDRKITVNKKSYYFDQQNHLLCQIQWGRNKSSKDQLSKYNDFFSGKILKLKSPPTQTSIKTTKQSQIVQQYGQIRGRLTQCVYYNNQLLFDISKICPHQIIDYVPCLQSDSRNRKDIELRKLNDFVKAQEMKEELEVMQRKDKKMRHDGEKLWKCT